MEWFYDDNGRQAGPVSRAEILDLIMQRRIGPQTLVWTPDFGNDWRPASAAGLVSPMTGLLRLTGTIPEHWAWVFLLGPWAMGRAAFYILQWRSVPLAEQASVMSLIGMFQLVLFFTSYMLDRRVIGDSGRKPPGFWWWLFWPGYFWRRMKVTGRGKSLFAVSLALLALNILDTARRFPEIERQLLRAEQGAPAPGGGASADGAVENL